LKPLKLLGLITVLITGFFLIYGVSDMPNWGDKNAPASTHVSPYYIQRSQTPPTSSAPFWRITVDSTPCSKRR